MQNVINILSKHDSAIWVEEGIFYGFRLHSHTYYEMTLYEHFDGCVEINEQKINLDTMTAILVTPAYFHKGDCGKNNGRYIKLAFDTDILPKNLSPKSPIVLKNIDKNSFLVSLFLEIADNSDNEEYKKVLVNTAVCYMLQNGKRIFSLGERGIGLKAVNIINENFDKPLTLSSVAQELYITPQYLSNVFRTEINMNFSRYLNLVRLRSAKKLLAETEESITKVCEMCGYGNLSHFLRSFKSEYGISPSNYRKNKRDMNKSSDSEKTDS